MSVAPDWHKSGLNCQTPKKMRQKWNWSNVSKTLTYCDITVHLLVRLFFQVLWAIWIHRQKNVTRVSKFVIKNVLFLRTLTGLKFFQDWMMVMDVGTLALSSRGWPMKTYLCPWNLVGKIRDNGSIPASQWGNGTSWRPHQTSWDIGLNLQALLMTYIQDCTVWPPDQETMLI